MNARTDGRTTFLSEFGVKALHFEHQSLDGKMAGRILHVGIRTFVTQKTTTMLEDCKNMTNHGGRRRTTAATNSKA